MVLITRTKVILTISIALSVLLSACGNATPQIVRIAVSLPLSIPTGQDILNAMQLALNEANGKAGNIPVELKAFDSSDPKGNPVSIDYTVSTSKDAIADPSIVAYIGPVTSDQARAVTPLLNNAQLTEVASTVTWPGLTKPGFGAGEPGIYYPTGQRHFFRLVPSDDVQGVMATHWIKQLGMKSIFVVTDTTAYSQGLAGIFVANAPDQSLTIVGQEQFDATAASDADLNTIVAHIVAAKPDAVYFPPGDTNDGRLFAALRTASATLPIVSTDAMTTEDLSAQAALFEGIYATNVTIGDNQIPAASDFTKNYQAAYHKAPPAFALTNYVAVQVILQAIKQADSPTRAGVLAAMSKLGNLTDALGTWHFDANGDTSLTTISGLQFKNGQWTTITIISA